MIATVFEGWWADARATSSERRVLMASTVGLAVLAAATAGVAHPLVLAAVIGVAVVAAFQPASTAGLVVIVIVAVRWLVTADDDATPTAIALAIELLAFHLVVATMAATPASARLPPTVARTWSARGLTVAATAPATWLLVAWFGARDVSGSSVLTAGALVALIAGAVAVHAPRDQASDDRRRND